MIFISYDIIQFARGKLINAATTGAISQETEAKLQKKYLTREGIVSYVKSVARPAREYLEDQLQIHEVAWKVIQHTSFFCPWNAKEQAGEEAIKFFKERKWIDENSARDLIKEIEKYVVLANASGKEFVLNH